MVMYPPRPYHQFELPSLVHRIAASCACRWSEIAGAHISAMCIFSHRQKTSVVFPFFLQQFWTPAPNAASKRPHSFLHSVKMSVSSYLFVFVFKLETEFSQLHSPIKVHSFLAHRRPPMEPAEATIPTTRSQSHDQYQPARRLLPRCPSSPVRLSALPGSG